MLHRGMLSFVTPGFPQATFAAICVNHMYCYVDYRSLFTSFVSRVTEMTDDLRNAIRTMRKNSQPTKSGVVRCLLPDIEDALMAGYRLKAVWEAVRSSGLNVSYAQFCVYFRRAQGQTRLSPATGRRKETRDSESDQGVAADPLANVHRQQATRPGFHYRGTEDLEVLIHGSKKDHGQ
jgi:hypothetical protein